MGFSPIYIGVNRTTDKPYEIINKISKTEKEVYSFCLDWIDKGCYGPNINIQKIGYSYLSTKIDKSKIDYVGFLDIDEFWFNSDNKKIQEFIDDNSPFDIASFFWICQFGEDTEFSPPFKDVLYNKIGKHVKSIVSTSSLDQVEIFSEHVPNYKENYYSSLVHIDQEGNMITSAISNKQFPIIDNKKISSCILHRLIRYEREYLSIVLTGRPSGELLKSNGRRGYKKGNIALPAIFDETYYTSLNKFIQTNDLVEILKQRRVEKLWYYKDKIESMNNSQLIAEINNAKDALGGTIGMDTFVNAFVKNIEDVESLRDFADGLESLDLTLSHQLIQKAHELKPSDPIIKEKLDKYQDKLQE